MWCQKLSRLDQRLLYYSQPYRQPTLEHGLCSESVAGLSWYASILCQKSHIYVKGTARIGKVAMKLLKLFNIEVPQIYYLYYGFVAVHTESPLLCMEMCLKGYKGEFSLV